MGQVIVSLISLSIGAGCWYLVFNEPARLRMLRPRWRLFNYSKEGKEQEEAGNLAVLVIAGVIATFFGLVLLVGIMIGQLF